jgi:hypothetical protein
MPLLLLTLGGITAVWGGQVSPAAPAALVMNPPAVVLQSPAVGVPSAAQAVTISNPGAASAALGTFSVSDLAHFSVDLAQCSGGVVMPGQQCVVMVRFQPTSTTTAADALAHTRSATTVILEGRVASVAPTPRPPDPRPKPPNARPTPPTPNPAPPAPAPVPPPVRAQAAIRPEALIYGTVEVLATARRPVALANVGTVPVSAVTWQVDGADRRDFRLEDAGCAQALGPGSSCQIEIEFSPSSTGERRAVLVARSGDRELDRVPVVGIGKPRPHPRAELTPNPVSFTNKEKDATVVVANLGDAPLQVSRVSLDNSKAFEIRNRDCEKRRTLNPGESCRVQVRFKGKASATGLLTVAHNDEASPTGVALAAEMTRTAMRPWLKGLIVAGAIAGTAAGIAAISDGGEHPSPPDPTSDGGQGSPRTPDPAPAPAPAQPKPPPPPPPSPTTTGPVIT